MPHSDQIKQLLAIHQQCLALCEHHDYVKNLPRPKPGGRIIIIGAGKAAAAMAQAVEEHYRQLKVNFEGIVVVPYGYQLECQTISVLQAAHPVPDTAAQESSKQILKLCSNLNAEDHVVCLLSGGGSALWCCPPKGVSLEDKQALITQLLRSGASIDEINCIRRHLSNIKGGQLAKQCRPATVTTFAISDVVGDAASVIASGPTVGDNSTLSNAIGTLSKYNIVPSLSILRYLNDPLNETPRIDSTEVSNSHFYLALSPSHVLEQLSHHLKAKYTVLNLGADLTGEARELGIRLGEKALELQTLISQPLLILSGGETTVTVVGSGRGGPNTEFLLGLSIALRGKQGIYALAADTDGKDGSEVNAGAILSPITHQVATKLKLNPTELLKNNDAYQYFEKTNSLLHTGPSHTNINDLRLIYIEPLEEPAK